MNAREQAERIYSNAFGNPQKGDNYKAGAIALFRFHLGEGDCIDDEDFHQEGTVKYLEFREGCSDALDFVISLDWDLSKAMASGKHDETNP